MWMLVLLLFLFGVSVGSFLNVIVVRTVHGESPLVGRSKCPHCGEKIDWKHNIPLFSFFLLHGKCTNCHKKISWQYPVVELLTGLLFVWWFVIGRSFFLLIPEPFGVIQPIFWLGVGVMLLLVLVFDFWYGVIPDMLNFSLLLWVLFYRLGLVLVGLMQGKDLATSLLSGLGVMAFFYFLYWVTKKKGFGFGDVKLAPSLGLLLGWPRVLIGVFMAFCVGAVVGIVLMLLGKKKFGQTIPFGPFLVLGTVVSLLWGGTLWDWYISMLG